MNIPPFPTHFQIQTTTACGADCSICPHPRQSPHWPNGPMSDELFGRLVDQLRGRPLEWLCPYLMADPLADTKIFQRVATLRAALPHTHLEISTTGMYLTPRIGEGLLQAPLSELRISSHGITAAEYAKTMPGINFDRAMANIRRFIDQWRQARPFRLNIVSLWGLWPAQREAEIEAFWKHLGVELSRWRVTSRAEQVDLAVFDNAAPDPTRSRRAADKPPLACRFQHDTRWMHILSDGRVTLCCMDYAQEEIVGDARRKPLEEIWRSRPFEEARAKVRGDLPTGAGHLCNRCEWRVSQPAFEDDPDANAAAQMAQCAALQGSPRDVARPYTSRRATRLERIPRS